MRVYFDNASTTPLLPEVKEVMKDVIDNHYGNPSSIHLFGRQSKTIIEDARKQIAERINASTGEVFFTSGATEANNMSLFGSVRDLGVQRIISSPTEHHCILHTLDVISDQDGVEVVYLTVDKNGSINLEELAEVLQEGNKKTLVSLMQANNEIGTLHPIELIAQLCQSHNALFHCDMAQSIGKYPLDLNTTPIAFLSGSAHKFYGPKGVGFVYVNNDNIIKPMFHGGDQERGMRSGTENIYGIAGMAKAYSMAYDEMEERHNYVSRLKKHFKTRLINELYDIQFNGDEEHQLYNVLSVSFPPSEKAPLIMMNLDIAGISASAGSACSSGVESDSHVLSAIGHDSTRKTVRFSLSHLNTLEEIDFVMQKLKKITPVPQDVES